MKFDIFKFADEFLTETDKSVFKAAGWGRNAGFGSRPAILIVDVNYNLWPMPEIFHKIMMAGEIPEEEMKNVYNLGIGYCLVVPEEVITDIQLRIHGHGYKSWVIGNINNL